MVGEGRLLEVELGMLLEVWLGMLLEVGEVVVGRKPSCWRLVVTTDSVVEAGCVVVVTVVLGWLDEACALQQATTTRMMMMGRTKSTIPAIVTPTAIPTLLPKQRDMNKLNFIIYGSGLV